MAFHDILKSLIEQSLNPTPAVLAIGLAFVFLFPILLHFILSSSSQYIVLPTILLAGPSGGGKTCLLTYLERRGNHVSTHLTQLPHSVELSVSSKPSPNGEKKTKKSSFRDDLDAQGATEASKFLVQDTPGHGKLRDAALKRLANATQERIKGVVFVVDAATLSDPEPLADAAAYLYDVLISLQKRMGASKSSRAPESIPVLVAANKADLFTALPAAAVKTGLETELGRIRSTRSRGLLDSSIGTDDIAGGDDESGDWLGQYGSKNFTFDQLMEFDIEVQVVSGNVEGKGPGVDKWWEWIAEQI